jgi:hypothetical protein
MVGSIALSFREASHASPAQALDVFEVTRLRAGAWFRPLEIAQHRIEFSDANAITLNTAKLSRRIAFG